MVFTIRLAGGRGGRNQLETSSRPCWTASATNTTTAGHSALDRRTPLVYDLLPKTGPTSTGPRHRVRHDHIDTTGVITLRHAGRLHHIGIGRAHTGTPVILLINDLDIRVLNTTTGELRRHLTLDPTRDYQPQE